MLPYLVSLVGAIALVLSLHKERLAAPDRRSVLRAIRLHHVAQFLVILLSLWVAVDAEREAKKLRVAQLNTAATAAAAKHVVPILDVYFLNLLPAGSTLKNYSVLDAALAGTHLSGSTDLILERASPMLARQRASAINAFNDLQRIARTVLAESAVYGGRYPAACVKWAERTLQLKQNDLSELFVDGRPAHAYADLTGKCVDSAMGTARDALATLEN